MLGRQERIRTRNSAAGRPKFKSRPCTQQPSGRNPFSTIPKKPTLFPVLALMTFAGVQMALNYSHLVNLNCLFGEIEN